MRILLTGGGTGGHISPHLALIPQLKKQNKLRYLGTYKAQEKRILRDVLDFPETFPICAGKLRRYLSIYTIFVPLLIICGVIQSFVHLLVFRPKIVFSTGGYGSIPVVFASALLRIPIVIHEQTRTMGLSNRIASHFAKRVLLSYPLENLSNSKSVLVGNPIRESFSKTPKNKAVSRLGLSASYPVLYFSGGMQGSHFINQLVEFFLDKNLPISIIHSTGENADYDKMIHLKKSLNIEDNRYFVKPYIYDDLSLVYSAVDLYVGRAGAGTVNEIAYYRIPALFIPLPLSADGEQQKNAEFLEGFGAAKIIYENRDAIKEVEEVIMTKSYKNWKSDVSVNKNTSAKEKIIKIITSYME